MRLYRKTIEINLINYCLLIKFFFKVSAPNSKSEKVRRQNFKTISLLAKHKSQSDVNIGPEVKFSFFYY